MRNYSVSPRASPVCGGSILCIEGIDDHLITQQDITVLVCIEGSSQRHICTTYRNPSTFCCSIPEHEPAENCKLLLIYYNANSKAIETVPLGTFLYQTDQTQLLAVYLAQSVDDLESLEDWDEIRGEGFSLCSEDFADFDTRLTAAFQHLLLPTNWSLLGNHQNQPTRETLYHFCARLGLVKFIRYLFTKPGALVCLSIPNRHGELPSELAHSRNHHELHQVLTDDNAVERYRLPLPETVELDNGHCLRHTERNTVNIDIDVSDESMRRPLTEDILLFSEALLQPTFDYPKLESDQSKAPLQQAHASYLRNELETLKNIQDNVELMTQEKISRRVSQITLHLSDSRSNSAPDLNDERNEVKMRPKKEHSDDFEVMPDVKRRSIIASHLSETLGSGERRRSWHESEHSLDRYQDGSTFIPRSRSYEHIDEPDLSEGGDDEGEEKAPIIINDGDIIQIDEILSKRRKSTTERRQAVIIGEPGRSSNHTSPSESKNRKNEERLLDLKKHHVPQKLSESTSSQSIGIRKPSVANIFKGLAGIQGQRKGRRSDKSPRSKKNSDMATIHSDTDTDTDNKRLRSLDRKVRRNESNSSADYISRNNSLKGSQADSVESEPTPPPSDFEGDAELNAADQPDTWFSFSDQRNKSQEKKLSNKSELKRQENIYELISTERNHYRTLRIMQKIFIGRMRAELNFSQQKCARFFPELDELGIISKEFLSRLTRRQAEYGDQPVENIADLLLDFWNSEWGERKALAYGRLCARQHDSLKFYKEELKNNKRFNTLIQKYKAHKLAKRLDVPDCIQLVTHRLTKYPLLLETIIKNTKNDDTEKEATVEALYVIKSIAQSVDGEMEEYRRKSKFEEIINNMDKTTWTKYKEKRFTKKDFTQRKLFNYFLDLTLKDKSKSYDVILLVMEDLLVLMTLKNGKYYFYGEQNTILSMQRIHFTDNAKDPNSLYIMGWNQEETTACWDLRAQSSEKRQSMINQLSLAKHSAPKSGIEKRRQDDERYEKMKKKRSELTAELQVANERIGQIFEETQKRQSEFHSEITQGIHLEREKIEDIRNTKLQLKEIQDLFSKSHNICDKIKENSCRHRSSPEESGYKISKADTFNGFDSSSSGKSSIPQDQEQYVSDQKSILTSASELSMIITKFQHYFCQKETRACELTNQLLLSQAGFRGSRGVLEAEQKRYQTMHDEQKKEVDELKRTYEAKLAQLNDREAELDRRLNDVEHTRQEQNKKDAELKQKWEEYQQNAQALRDTRKRLPAEIQKDGTALNVSGSSSTSLHRAPVKQPRPRDTNTAHSSATSRRLDQPRKDAAQLPLHIAHSAVNQNKKVSSDPRASTRSNGSSTALLGLAVSSSSSKPKLATSTSKGKLKKV